MKFILKNILLFFIIFLNSNLYSQFELKFNRLSEKQGLGDTWIHSLTQDKNDYIWVGAGYGLYRFDAFEFKTYLNDILDTNSLADNFIKLVFCDSKGNLWIGHRKGLSRYNYEKDNFINYCFDFYTNYIQEDKDGIFWISTNKGLAKFNPETNELLQTYFYNDEDENSIDYPNSTMNYEDSKGNFWVATDVGLNIFDKTKGTFKKYDEINAGVNCIIEDSNNQLWIGSRNGLIKYDEKNSEIYFENKSILKIYEDFNKNLWVGTYDFGLYYIDIKNNKTSNFINDPTQITSLPNDKVCDLFISRDKILWIATYGGGVCNFDFNTLSVKYYRHNTVDEKSLSSNDIFSFYVDNDENIWVATFTGGLNLFDKNFNKIKTYLKEDNNSNSLNNNTIYTVRGNGNRYVYLATFGGGFDIFDTKNRTFKHHTSGIDDSTTISYDETSCLYQEISGDLWIGTMKGLNFYSFETKKFTRFLNHPNDSTSLSSDNVWAVFRDCYSNLWVGTKDGLNLYNDDNKNFKQIKNISNDTTSLINSHVWCIFQDSKKRLWIGTLGGLCLYNYENKTFKSYTEEDGLSNNVVFGIIEDDHGNLWISTNKILNKFNPETEEFFWYDETYGFQSNEFNPGSYYKDNKGNFYFGGTNGFNVFNPDSIKLNTFVPNVVLTNFLLFNEPIKIDYNSVLKESLDFAKVIELNYDDYIFAFEFSALCYRSSEKNLFAYKLDGFNEDWIYTDYDDRKAVFTNVPHGTYTFMVKASNSDGVWNNSPKCIIIIINPPWWKTWWAITLWIFLFFGTIVSIYLLRVSALENQKKVLELKVEQRTLEIVLQKEEIQAQAEELEVINEELQKLSIAVSQTDNAIMIMDKDGNFQWLNDGFTKLYGYTLDEYKLKYSNIFQEISKEETISQIKECIKNKRTYIYEDVMYSRTGEIIDIQTTITPILNTYGEVDGIIAIDADIRKLKKVETELKIKNQLVTDSISYAKSIQNAILPLKENIEEQFKTFIIYKPKDIISGDFYWYNQVSNYFYFAVIDCTGHGVPAALLSMIGNTLLNEIIISLNTLETNQILELLHEMLIKSLRLDRKDINEGMDVCLVRIEKDYDNISIDNRHIFNLQYTGAKRQLLVLFYKTYEIEVKNPDRKSIGAAVNSNMFNIPYTAQEFVLNSKDRIYLFTDGFTDQHNNARKKFGNTKLKEILTKTADIPIHIQGEIVEEELGFWMENQDQRDDITLIGIEL